MPGLLQEFKVASDTIEQLDLVLRLTFSWSRKGAAYFKAGNDRGFDWIEFYGYETNGAQKLPYPLDTPEKLIDFVKGWISSAERGEEYDTDGSVSEGWLVSRGDCWQCIARVRTEWIVYGK